MEFVAQAMRLLGYFFHWQRTRAVLRRALLEDTRPDARGSAAETMAKVYIEGFEPLGARPADPAEGGNETGGDATEGRQLATTESVYVGRNPGANCGRIPAP